MTPHVLTASAIRPQARSLRSSTAPPIQVLRTVAFRRAAPDAVISRIPTCASATGARTALAALVVLGLGIALIYAGLPILKNVTAPPIKSRVAQPPGEAR